ncbi:MAG: DUF177 domain-containing protein [Desulfovibrio sp.]|nr:DUF177 domain-containing protein [Desulfovibrio sp.]
MQEYRLSFYDVPPDGADFSVDDPAIWQEPLLEFHMDCRVDSALKAQGHILPVDNGWLVRGSLTGRVVVPCSRCAEDALVPIDVHFEIFAAAKQSASSSDDANDGSSDDMDADAYVVWCNNVPMLDLTALCWEEFVLALPANPLCCTSCKGLCAHCGANLNQGPCTCREEEGDPRMAALRGFIVHNN